MGWGGGGRGECYLQPVHLTDGCVNEVVCVGGAAAETDAQVPTQLRVGPWRLDSKEGGNRHTVHLHSQHGPNALQLVQFVVDGL